MAPVEPAERIAVEVVYCPAPGVIDATPLQLPLGATAADALQASGVLERHGIAAADARIGVWCRACEPTQRLRERDRVEVYRALKVDPKEARRLRYQGSRRQTAAKRAPPR